MLKLTSGHSQKNSIRFSTRHTCATAIRNENGEIEIKNLADEQNSSSATTLLLAIIAISVIKSFILMPLIKADTIGVIWYLLPAAIYAFIAIYGIVDLRHKQGISGIKNHGAEHMVYSAYKSLKRIPTIEEARRFSRINRACGVNLFSAFITSQLIGFFTYIYADFVISEIILFLVPSFLHAHFPFNILGNFAQFWTTSTPDDENIELALVALKALESREKLSEIVSTIFDSISQNK